MDALSLWQDCKVPDSQIPSIEVPGIQIEQVKKLYTVIPVNFFLGCPHTWEALAITILIFYLKGIHRTDTDLVVSSRARGHWGLSRITVYRGLEQLERAGLIRIVRRKGKGPTITILSNPESPAVENLDLVNPAPNHARAKMAHICKHCGKVFLARKGAKYCSGLCRWHGYNNRKKARVGEA